MPRQRIFVKIRVGYEFVFSAAQSVPMILMVHAQLGTSQRFVRPDRLITDPQVPYAFYTDVFGNSCTRLECPAGTIRMTTDAIIEDSGVPEAECRGAQEHPVRELPESALMYLLSSRYCETDLLMQDAWRLFGHLRPGWARVQAICDFVNQHVTFGYEFARSTKTALDTYRERQGVCRDLAHLAISFCRCMNIPARYCTGYLGDIGVPVVDAPMDFAGSMEVYLGGAWHAFDPRNNARRIGRLIIARGRDAADVAITTSFGPIWLQSFKVWTDEIKDIIRLQPQLAMPASGLSVEAA
jgi:transglutaminase-like putative cysteine protease